MRRLMRDDSGAVAVTVALVLLVIVGMAALAVDAGYLYSVRRQLQTAADAAALAGCRVMIEGGTEGNILAEARVYAEDENGVRPADGAVMATDPPGTVVDFTERSVQVTVTKQAPLFFARVWGSSDTQVVASAKARVAYLTGMRGIVPWSVPIIRARRVAARVAGGAEYPLSDMGDGRWVGTIPVPMGVADAGKIVDVIAYNDQTAYPDGTSEYPQGVPEPLAGAAAVVVRAAASPLVDVSLNHYVVTNGETSSVLLTVRAAEKPSARFNNKNYNLTPVPGETDLWRATLTVPLTDYLHEVFPVQVTVGKKTIDNAAFLVVRRPTYPILDVSLSRHVLTAGDPGSVTVSVQLNDFQYGTVYPLKVVSGAEVGNFAAVRLAEVFHAPNWRNPSTPEYDLSKDPHYKPPAYYNYLENEFPFVLHIGDTIWTEPGNLSGPSTDSALDARFAGNVMTFAAWEALDRPPSSRIVYVPVVEKMQDLKGYSPVRIVSFAAFYVDPGSEFKGLDAKGVFIEYATPADGVTDQQPDGLYIETVRLVTPN